MFWEAAVLSASAVDSEDVEDIVVLPMFALIFLLVPLPVSVFCNPELEHYNRGEIGNC